MTPPPAQSTTPQPTTDQSASAAAFGDDGETIEVPIPIEQQTFEVPIPDVSDLVTEDDTPVDNLLQEKLQRFLVQCLYSSLKVDIPFLATCDVGLFYSINEAALVPDVMLSLGVTVPDDWSQKRNRSYFVWELGKPPEVAIEIVSNKKGHELDRKLADYARAGVAYYAIFDPLEQLSQEILQVYVLHAGHYQRLENSWLESVGLGLTVWQGTFETKQYDRWLRWCDRDGNLLLTGDERAEQERQRAERLAELLRSQGIDPDA